MSAAVRAGGYLHHLQLQSSEPAQLAAFYADAMDMQARSINTGDWLCEGPLRRLLITQGANRMLGFAAYACRDGDGLAAIRVQADRNGVDILPSPSPLFGPTAFAVRDPDGSLIAFGLSDQEQPRSGLRGPIQHLTLATKDPAAIERFYVEKLGFITSDYVRDAEGKILVCWMRSNHEHHTLACFLQSQQGSSGGREPDDLRALRQQPDGTPHRHHPPPRLRRSGLRGGACRDHRRSRPPRLDGRRL